MVLLIDERPEEVTDMQRTQKVKLLVQLLRTSSRHVAVAEMVIEKAKRLTEHKGCSNIVRFNKTKEHIML